MSQNLESQGRVRVRATDLWYTVINEVNGTYSGVYIPSCLSTLVQTLCYPVLVHAGVTFYGNDQFNPIYFQTKVKGEQDTGIRKSTNQYETLN